MIALERPSVAEFAALYDSTGWGSHSLDVLERALDGSWFVATARVNGELVGMGRVISDGALHAFITEMIVAPDHRGTGIGAELLRALVDECGRRGITDVQLFAASGRAGFYERNGFAPRPADAPGMQLR